MEKIILNEKLKTSFIKAGWYENRDISNRYLKVKDLKHFPETIRNFLFEYGDLILKPYESDHFNEYDFSTRLLKNQTIIFKNLCDVELYKIGDWLKENTMILCDNNLTIYLYDEMLSKLGNSLQEGFEFLLEMNFKNQLYWDFQNKEWTNLE
ncbi:SUKH-3 domain-containing protein [Flavobacterium sediminilitoris]|uniref:SUKH-3 domain-containing protein n=1 Tax=Flavobacterium sediminilitoris TaxID=2024526 RepID=A0ABY4HKR3_9FLAO|nr:MULTISPECIES: SUKH-3 domain-containing protein [Flavobacterium]UOX33125.1 SUKH-3 domain-containing protein [Flavobacterium sediminilitoris]